MGIESAFTFGFLVLTFGIVNFVRGRGYIETDLKMGTTANRIAASSFFSVAATMASMAQGYASAIPAEVFIATFVGILIWSVPGWGLYFAAFTGTWPPGKTQIKWIDRIGVDLVPYIGPNDVATNRKRGMICMAIRGLFLTPYTIALSVILGNPMVAPLGLLGASQGLIYGAMRWLPNNGTYGVMVAEPIFGAVIGVITAFALVGL